MELSQTIALEALAYVASDEQMLGRFLALTGMDAAGLYESAAETATQAAVLDFLMRGEKDLMAFCAHSGKPASDVFWSLHALDPLAAPEMPPGLTRKR
jgi:hypothetical protein